MQELAGALGDAVRRTIERGGKVLVPAFSLGRTQVVLHFLRLWMRDGVLPNLPLYVDSPLAHDLSGPRTLGELFELLGELDLFPGAAPVRQELVLIDS